MTVLVAYVPTPEGVAALAIGIAEAKWRGSRMVVVNVAVGQNFADATFADEKDLDAVRQRLAEEGVAHDIRQILEASDVGGSILEVAGQTRAELIVLGLRRMSPIGKFLLGSTIQDVMRGADCPVLTVRPPHA